MLRFQLISLLALINTLDTTSFCLTAQKCSSTTTFLNAFTSNVDDSKVSQTNLVSQTTTNVAMTSFSKMDKPYGFVEVARDSAKVVAASTALALVIVSATISSFPEPSNAANTASPSAQTISTTNPTASKSVAPSKPVAPPEPAEKKALNKARSDFEAANSLYFQKQKELTAAKSASEKATIAVSKADAASKSARTNYINSNDKLIQIKSDRSVKESVIVQQQQKVAELQAASRSAASALEKSKSESKEAATKLRSAEAALQSATKAKSKAADGVKVAEKNYAAYQKRQAENEKKAKKAKELADKKAKKEKEEAEKKAKIEAQKAKEKAAKIAAEKAAKLAKEKKIAAEKAAALSKQLKDLEREKRALEQTKVASAKAAAEKEAKMKQQQKELLEIQKQQQKLQASYGKL